MSLCKYLSGDFQNIISSLYSFSKQCVKFTEQIMSGLAGHALTRINNQKIEIGQNLAKMCQI